MRGPSLDLRSKIQDRIATRPDDVWTPTDFLDLGPRSAVDKALQRLAASDDLRRIDRGLYDAPRHNPLTGRLSVPSTRAIVDAVARRDKARLLIDGMTAANDLGLTTAVPAQVTVLTDARLRPIRLGDQTIQFKQAAPSRLYWAGRPAMRVVQALHWLRDVVRTDRSSIDRQLRYLLHRDPRAADILPDLMAGLPAMPIWMQDLVRPLAQDLSLHEHHHDRHADDDNEDDDHGDQHRRRQEGEDR